jgi:hypothetical protein
MCYMYCCITGTFARAAHGLSCARGLQLSVFVVAAHEVAWLWGAKAGLSAWLSENTENPRFFRVVLVAARAGDFGRRQGGSRGLWREGKPPSRALAAAREAKGRRFRLPLLAPPLSTGFLPLVACSSTSLMRDRR